MIIAVLIGCIVIVFNGWMLLSQHSKTIMGPIFISLGSIALGITLLAIKGGAA